MKDYIKSIFSYTLIFLPFLSIAQTKKIRDEIKRAGKYEESKKFDTYHVYEKYLTTEQRYHLNMYYWGLCVDAPNENSKNYWLLKSARANNVCAQINLSYSYKIGRTVNRDSIKCRYWLLKAINNKSTSALFYYGLSCTNGVFSKSANDSALFFLEKANESKMAEACLAISYCYKYGINAIKNDSLAMKYFLIYKRFFTTNYNRLKENFADLDSSIYCPTGYCNRELIEIQIPNYLKQLQSDSLLELSIECSGNGNYLEQQQSWDKSNFIRTIFVENGLDQKRISFNYGGNGNLSIVKIIVKTRTEEFMNIFPPPPIPNLRQKYFILECE